MTKDEPRFVLDTNVLIDALMFPRSWGRKAFERAMAEGEIVASDETLAELAAVLYRERFDPYITDIEREAFLRMFAATCTRIVVEENVQASRDADDDKFLSLAIAAGARIILSRDRDLLDLSPFKGILILEPKTFVEET